MITFGATLASDALPGAAMNPDAAGAVANEGAGDFGNVLEQLMGTASGKGAGVDLPLEDEGQFAEDPDLDELVNANIVDLGAQPIIRLVLAPTWALTDTPATPAAATTAVDSAMVEGSVSASAFMSQPAGGASPAVDESSVPFEALMAEAAEETPAATSAPVAEQPAASASVPAAANMPMPVPAEAAAAAAPAPAATPGTSVVPTPEASPREAATASTPARRGTDKHEASRPAFRVTADAGQRAYAAAASDEPKKDTQQGFSDGRTDGRDAVARGNIAPATADNASAATPFQAVMDRPSAPAPGPTLAASVVTSAETIDATVAAELPAQVVQSIRMQAIDGGGEAIVRLRPDYLGELVVAVKVENGAVSAALQSDTPAVRKWVENNEATLRQGLADVGLHLERLTVSDEAPSTDTGERQREDGSEPEGESQQHPRRQRKPAPDATFEVVV